MKNKASFPVSLVVLLLCGALCFSFSQGNFFVKQAFPYKQEGLTERQAAAHLLSRFTFGATPGQVDEVVKLGLENWLEQQLTASRPDEELNQRLEHYSSLGLTNEQIARTYPKGGQLLRMAMQQGVVDKEALANEGKAEHRKALKAYMEENGYKPPRALNQELINQKILRAVYTQNQLQELLTSFWFNHFNVSLTDNDCARFILTYERDAIRPHALGRFEDLLLATAKSPAMLTYLDNFMSAAPPEAMTPEQQQQEQRRQKQLKRQQRTASPMQQEQMAKVQKRKKEQGLNENYAREIMELHTLGVDGGYTQSDVTQAARVFTGWTVFPGLNAFNLNQKQQQQLNNLSNSHYLQRQGFVREGDFLFAANKHDKGAKMVLGVSFPAGGGYEEGQQLIRLLAQHPATAHFISTKLAIRFVSDNPPAGLVDKMAKTFTSTKGDIKQVLVTMVQSREFWSKEVLREKTKSPFELAVSSVRSLNADVTAPAPLAGWIARMGEKMYAYQAPTGFPDKGQYWINTGSLLTRMNFGLALVSRRIPGVQLDLAALHQNREPESPEQALLLYSRSLMPERNLDETIKRLTPFLTDPEYSKKVENAASQAVPVQEENDTMMEQETMTRTNRKGQEQPDRKTARAAKQMAAESEDNRMLAQVVGIIIGSPEFQRR